MLPTNAEVDITCLYASALALHIVEEFRPDRKIVQRREFPVEIRNGTNASRRAGDLGDGALGKAWAVSCRNLRRPEGKPVRRDNSHGCRVVGVQNVALTECIGLEGEMPSVVELVIIRAAEPLEIVIAPGTAVDAVRDEVEVVI